MPHKLGLVFVVVLYVMATTMPSVNADCWWTGCQPETWAVVGCDHYNRKETGRKPCKAAGVQGNKYNCCSKDGGGGDEGGDEEGEEDFKFMENPPGLSLATMRQGFNLSSDLKQASSPSDTHGRFKDIEIPQGKLRGFIKKSREGREYLAYYKVPYAEPPVGKLRFMDPIPPQSTWSGVRAETDMPRCIQKHTDAIRSLGDEDCLYTNIFVPIIDNSTGGVPPLPVMVFIHGGGFTDGSGSRYSAEYFMDEDVILVMLNYRLGPFAFIQYGEILGNMGFKDQVEMLRWNQRNIAFFGGDPNRVTIFGNSAGGFSVSFLALSPMATGLFHRAIAQSGTNVCASSIPGLVNRDPMTTIKEMGRLLNCGTSSSTQFLECVQTKSASDIAVIKTPLTTYALTIERRNDGKAFMPEEPYQILKTNPHKIPIIIGITNSERAGEVVDYLSDSKMATVLNKNFIAIAGPLLFSNLNPEQRTSVKKFYFGDKKIDKDTYMDLANLASDRVYGHCSYVSALMHSDFSPAFLYVVTKPPGMSNASKKRPGIPFKELGLVTHGDEVQYEFPYQGAPVIPKGDPEYFEFSKTFIKLFVQFAATGIPDPDWLPVSRASKPVFWYDLNDRPNQTTMMQDRMDFWDQFDHKQLRFDVM